MDIHEPVEVYTVNEPFKAELIKDALMAEGMRCALVSSNQGGFAGLNMEPVRIFVGAADADRARKLIESHEGRDDRESE